MLTVVLTTWNPGPYLDEAIDSVIANRGFEDMELVVVDDGSGCREFLDKAVAKYGNMPNVSFMTVPHGGPGAARNAGVRAAKGEWIVFCDDDDRYHPGAFTAMLDAAKRHGADMAMARFNEDLNRLSVGGKTTVINGRQAALRCLHQTYGVQSSPCAKLLRRDMLLKSAFQDTIYEDLELMPLLMAQCRRVACMTAPLYWYRQRPGSILHTFDSRRLQVLDVTESLEKCFAADPTLYAAARDRRFSAACNMLLLYKKNHPELTWRQLRDDEVVRRCVAIIRERRRGVLLGRGTRFKNRLGAFASALI